MKKGTGYISNLTPLRAVAALFVAFFHFEAMIGRIISKDITLFFTKGYLMVDLFFIMSGFIILHVYQQSFEGRVSASSFKKFILARFARIYPLHLFTLCVLIIFFYTILHQSEGLFWNFYAIPTHLLMMQSFGFHSIFTWNIPSWSISAEWWAYMIFPFIAAWMYKRKKVALIGCTAFVIVTYFALMYVIPIRQQFSPLTEIQHNLDITFEFGFLRGIAGFVAGMIVYQGYQRFHETSFLQKNAFCILSFAAIILAFHFNINDGLCMILFAAIVLAVAGTRGFIHRICNNRVLQFLGDISYSIYMMQWVIIVLVRTTLDAIGLGDLLQPTLPGRMFPFWRGSCYASVFILILIGFSTLTYYLIELPCRKWINKKWAHRNFVQQPINVSLK